MKTTFALLAAAGLVGGITAAPANAFQKPPKEPTGSSTSSSGGSTTSSGGTTVPEPAGIALLGLGLGLYMGGAAARRRKNAK